MRLQFSGLRGLRMALFKKKLSDDPKELWEDFFRVVMKNEWKKALGLIEALKQLEPDNAQVHMKMGDILQRTGDPEGAVPAYHQAATCLISSEDFSKALAIYKIILRLNPDDEDAVARSHELIGGTPVAPQPQQHMTYEEATGEGGEYYEDHAEGEGDSQQEGVSHEEGADEAGAYEEAPAEADSNTEEPGEYSQPDETYTEETYTEEATVPPAVSQDYEASADDAIAGLYDAPEQEAPAPEPVAPEPRQEPEPREEPQAAAPQAGSKALQDAFKRHPIFKVLSDEDIDIMIKKASHSILKDGEPVINEDEPGDSMFIIKKGQARVTSTMFDKTYELATLGGGNFFGEVGFLTGMPRTATVTSKGGLSVMEINKPLMQELIERNPKVLQKLVELSHSRTRKKMKKIND